MVTFVRLTPTLVSLVDPSGVVRILGEQQQLDSPGGANTLSFIGTKSNPPWAYSIEYIKYYTDSIIRLSRAIASFDQC